MRAQHDGGMMDYVTTYQQVVYTFCYRSTGDVKCAQTMVQKVFELAWSTVRSGTASGEAARLLKMAYHCCKQQPRADSMPAFVAADGQPVDVQALLLALPLESRCLAVMHYCCGLTLEEVAAVAELSLAEVKVRLLQARRAAAMILTPASVPGYTSVSEAAR